MHRTGGRSDRSGFATGHGEHLALCTWGWTCARLAPEVRHLGTIGGDLVTLDRHCARSSAKALACPLVYEAGTCGFAIWRHLTTQGVACEVTAPSSLPKRAGDRVKTDRRDALMLARLSRSSEFTSVRVPGAADEAVRDLVRAREDAVRECHTARRCAPPRRSWSRPARCRCRCAGGCA